MNNPPAFPNDVKPINERVGMTLRDYFAAKAMQAHTRNTMVIPILLLSGLMKLQTQC